MSTRLAVSVVVLAVYGLVSGCSSTQDRPAWWAPALKDYKAAERIDKVHGLDVPLAISAYQEFIDAYPPSKYPESSIRDRAQQRIAYIRTYNDALAANTVEVYESVLGEFPAPRTRDDPYPPYGRIHLNRIFGTAGGLAFDDHQGRAVVALKHLKSKGPFWAAYNKNTVDGYNTFIEEFASTPLARVAKAERDYLLVLAKARKGVEAGNAGVSVKYSPRVLRYGPTGERSSYSVRLAFEEIGGEVGYQVKIEKAYFEGRSGGREPFTRSPFPGSATATVHAGTKEYLRFSLSAMDRSGRERSFRGGKFLVKLVGNDSNDVPISLFLQIDTNEMYWWDRCRKCQGTLLVGDGGTTRCDVCDNGEPYDRVGR